MDEIKIERYPAYKDSGVDWLGELPEHWDVQKGKWLFEKQERVVRDEDDIITCFRDGQVTLRKNRKTEGFTNALKEHGYQGIRKGDLVIHNMDAFAGAIGVSDSDGKSTPVYSACTPRKANTINVYYYAYFLRNLAKGGFIESLAKGIRERSTDFRFSDFGILLLSKPPLEEQNAIVNFVDRKAAQIDNAIAQKEKLIKLLKERRQILIHKAVTRGLNPDVPMKDSGVEWIGEIPEHWEVKKMRSIFDYIQTGTTPSTTNTNFFDGNINWFTPKDLNEEILNLSERKVSKLAIQKREIKFFPGNSVLIVGIGATAGKASYMPESSTFNQQITGFHTRENNNKYYFYLLKDLAKVMLNTADFTTLPILNNEFFKAFTLTVPPIEEQNGIVAYIEGLSSKVKKAIEQEVKEIAKLKEYKATLINAAVTGKIKVI